MEPTLYNDDVLLAEYISVVFEKLEKGDIIISRCPRNFEERICKRIVGLPGDKVQDGSIVPKGHVWLEGDNKYNSDDSRNFGPVPQYLLQARVLCKILPLKDMVFYGMDYVRYHKRL